MCVLVSDSLSFSLSLSLSVSLSFSFSFFFPLTRIFFSFFFASFSRDLHMVEQVKEVEKRCQNTVPSDMIIIGGSFVFGRETSASSRPPCGEVKKQNVSVSLYPRRVEQGGERCVRKRGFDLPRPCFEHLCQTQLVRPAEPELRIDLSQ